MYITCEQCSTIFRLNETLLKPAGSKVRCSQCSHIFVASPPLPDPVIVAETGIAAAVAGTAGLHDTFDQELEGIDLAELDSILENNEAMRNGDAPAGVSNEADAEELVEFNEADLDFDFESALEEDAGDELAEAGAGDFAMQAADEKPDAGSDELDLDMDFELDDSLEASAAVPAEAPEAAADEQIDLDMDFELEEEPEGGGESLPADGDFSLEEVELGEDVELALDEFADVLGAAEGDAESGRPAPADSLLEEDISDAAAAEAVAVATDAPGDIDLGDFDALLDSDEDDGTGQEPVDEDTELSLADDDEIDMAPDEEAPDDAEGPAAAAETDEADDDFDLAGGLDELLEEDEQVADAGQDQENDLSLDEDLELELSDETDNTLDADTVESAPAADQDVDDLDLDDIDLLLESDETTAETDTGDDVLSLDEVPDIDLSDIDLSEVDAIPEGEELELDLEEAPALEEALSAELDAEDEGLALDDDFDIDLSDIDLPETDEGPEAEGLDLELEEAPALEEALPAEADAEDEGLALDDDFDIDLSDIELAETDEASEAEELDLELEEIPEAEPPAGTPAAEMARDEFDLSDFESLLSDDDVTAQPVPEPEAAPGQGEDGEGFDLADLDDLLEDSADAADGEDIELSADDDLEISLDDDLSLDMDADAPSAVEESQADGDDFDLSMLETDALDDDAEDDREVPDEDMELSLDDDMELTMEDAPAAQADAGDASEADFGDIEDLDFELDAEFEDKPIFQAPDDAGDSPAEALVLEEQENSPDEELDLTDIEKMLEDDAIVPDVAETSGDDDLDLEAEGAEIWADDADGDFGLGDDEIDLSELEDALNSPEYEKAEASFADGEDDLDLDLEPEITPADEEPEALELDLEMEDDSAAKEPDAGSEDELDLSEYNLSLEEEKSSVETETIDGGDIQLEFQVDASAPNDLLSGAAETFDAATAITTEFSLGDETFSEEDTITTELVKEVTETEVRKPSSAPRKKKGGVGKLLVIVLVLAALGGGGYYGYDYVVKHNINIPYLSDYINPEAKDPSGVIKLSTSDINGKFIENEAAGRIFAVTGKVRNGYSVPRKLIRLRGKLYVKGNPQPKNIEHTFAGLTVADQELSSKSLAEIKKQLSTTTGKDADITVAPGKTAPFMVIFADLPADLDQYDIELVSSIKAQ